MGGEHLTEGVADLHVAVEIQERVGDRVGQAAALIVLGDAQMARGDLLAARKTFEQALALNRELNNPPEEVFGILNLALVSYELGELREAVRYARETLTMANAMEIRIASGMAMAVEAAAHFHMGELEEVQHRLGEAVQTAREIKNKYLESLVLPYQLEVLLGLGHFKAAATAADELAALVQETGNHDPEALLTVRQAQLAGRRGELEAADKLAARALEQAHQKSSQALVAHAQAVRAWLALLGNRPRDAMSLGQEALGLATSRGMGMLAADLEGLLGEVALVLHEGGAGARYQAMAAWAAAQGAPLQAALAEFGLAACEPASGGARAVEARTRMQRLVALLDADGRVAFSSRKEVKRVLDGDLTVFARGAAVQAPPGQHRPLGLDQGLRKLF
jgi:tetratricopeptide (TPR) repeat protein